MSGSNDSSNFFAHPEIINRVGFPVNPSCFCYSQEQDIVGIGTNAGLIQIISLYSPNLRYSVEIPLLPPISQMIFLKKTAQMVVLCTDQVLLIDYTSPLISIKDRLTFKSERTNHFHLFQDTFLFCGTNKGNVYVINIKEGKLILMPYCIFWNQSCKGFASVHPGAVIYTKTCSECKIIYIVFSNGIISTFSLSDKQVLNVSNAFEKLYCCTHADDRTLAFGCDNSAVLYYDIKNHMFTRSNFSTGYSTIGAVWKVASPYDNNLKSPYMIVVCAGGTCTETSDTGCGLSIFVENTHQVLSNDIYTDILTYINDENKMSILGLTRNDIISFEIDLDPKESSFSTPSPVLADKIDFAITCLCPVMSIDIHLEAHDVLTTIWNHIKLEILCLDISPNKTINIPFLLLFVGLESGTLKLLILDCEMHYIFPWSLDTSDSSSVIALEFSPNTNCLISYHSSNIIHVNSLVFSTSNSSAPKMITLVEFSDSSTFISLSLTSPETAVQPDVEESEGSNDKKKDESVNMVSMCCLCLIKPFSGLLSQKVFGHDFESHKLLTFENNSIFFIDTEKWAIFKTLNIATVMKEDVKQAGLLKKGKYKNIFKLPKKMSLKEVCSKDFFIVDLISHKILIDQQLMDILFACLSSGPVVVITLTESAKVHSLDLIHDSSSPIFKIIAIDNRGNKITNTDSVTHIAHSDPTVLESVIIVAESSITKLKLDLKIENVYSASPPSASGFSQMVNFVDEYLACICTNNILSVFELSNLKYFCKVDLNFMVQPFSSVLNRLLIVPDCYFLHLVVLSSPQEISWVSLSREQQKKYLLPKLYNKMEGKKEKMGVFKILYNFLTDKNDSIHEIFASGKDVNVEVVAKTTASTQTESHLLEFAEERNEKLSKAAQQAERLAQHASSFNQTASKILEMSKRGLL